jgi:uncharacterized membrane protein YbhN (UPF0104 family)
VKLRPAWLAAGALLLSTGLCAVAMRPSLESLGPYALGATLARLAPAALAVVAGEILCRAVRLVAMTAALGHRTPLRTALRITLLGDCAAAVTPGNSGGEPARFLALRSAGLAWSAASLTLALEFAADMLALAALLLGVVVTGDVPPVARRLGPAAAAGLIAALAVALVVVRVVPGISARLTRGFAELRAAATLLRSHRAQLCLGLVASAGHCLLRFSVLPVIAASLGIALDLRTLVVWQLLAFYALAFAPTPGGSGGVEIGFLLYFRGRVAPEQLGLLLAGWRFFSYHVSALAGGLALTRGDARGNRGAPGQHQADAVLEREVGLENVLGGKHDDVAQVEMVRGDVHAAERFGGAVGAGQLEAAGEEAGARPSREAHQDEALEALA